MLHKTIGLLLAVVMTFSLVGCAQAASPGSASNSAASNSAEPANYPDELTEKEKKTLVVYFSWSGNTKEMADYLQERVQGDLLELKPETSYPTDYSACADLAKRERDSNTRPAIANLPQSIEEYDIILIGYPIWWHTAPMIVGTFLESFDLTGVEVYPFTQSTSMDTDQFTNSMEFVREISTGATVHDGLFVKPSDTASIDAYLADNGLLPQ